VSTAPRIVALVVAAGTGVRVGGEIPKQYRRVGGKPLLCHSIDALMSHPAIHAVQVVIHPDHENFYADAIGNRVLPTVHGGAARADSVREGLTALASLLPDYVLIHDAARPFLSHAVIDRLIAALAPDVGVIPALGVHDTVRRTDGNVWSEVPRDGLFRIQTPQAFPYAALCEAYATIADAPTDEAAVWLACGHTLRYVDGDESLRKVTTANDINWAASTFTKAPASTRSVVGMGFDVHELMPSGNKGVMRIGGIDIPSTHTLHGHSDADVVLHAIVDALLGTIADGDIGQHFPPLDARWKGADSGVFIRETVKKIHAQGGTIQHVDVTIICEAPKMSPHRDAMRARIAELLELPLQHISVKATTTERLGFTGRGEGIAAQAVATVSLLEGT
jgi:2-C-methyl-D-erythritol 4-phosphate cytidylyltransferase/2-C-methyl-D-erythritol 2,4-cyclodiphosphate synthase